VIAEGTAAMMILTVHVVGNGAAHSDPPGARCDRQHPAGGEGELLDIPQQCARLALQDARLAIEPEKAIQAAGGPQRPARVETAVAVTATHAIGDTGFTARSQLARDAIPVVERTQPVLPLAQTTPGGDGYHGQSRVPR
jgi:hypothetical protein